MTQLAAIDGFLDDPTTAPPVVIVPGDELAGRVLIQSDTLATLVVAFAPTVPVPPGFHLVDAGALARVAGWLDAGAGFPLVDAGDSIRRAPGEIDVGLTTPGLGRTLPVLGSPVVLPVPPTQPRLQPGRGFRAPSPWAQQRPPYELMRADRLARRIAQAKASDAAAALRGKRRVDAQDAREAAHEAAAAERKRAPGLGGAGREPRPGRAPRKPRPPRAARTPRRPRAPRRPRTSGTKRDGSIAKADKKRKPRGLTAEQARCKALYEAGPTTDRTDCHWNWLGFVCKCTPSSCQGPLSGYLRTLIGFLPKGWFPKPVPKASPAKAWPRPRGPVRFTPSVGGTLAAVPLAGPGPVVVPGSTSPGCATGSVCCAGLTGVGCGPAGPSCAPCNAREAAALLIYSGGR